MRTPVKEDEPAMAFTCLACRYEFLPAYYEQRYCHKCEVDVRIAEYEVNKKLDEQWSEYLNRERVTV